uniref:Uncharacterized protein n=1 Tax=Romanomermis culicivorax TaxID=13658 RepID=A0A915I9F9_ROMCU
MEDYHKEWCHCRTIFMNKMPSCQTTTKARSNHGSRTPARRRKWSKEEEEEKEEKHHDKGHKSRSWKQMPAYYQHDDCLDVSYASRTSSLDRARNEENVQSGAKMSNTNVIGQEQAQLTYCINANKCSSTYALSNWAISDATGRATVLPSIFGTASHEYATTEFYSPIQMAQAEERMESTQQHDTLSEKIRLLILRVVIKKKSNNFLYPAYSLQAGFLHEPTALFNEGTGERLGDLADERLESDGRKVPPGTGDLAKNGQCVRSLRSRFVSDRW